MEPNGIIKKHIAPCGLHCGGCFAFNGGNIQRHSDEPVFENYQSFKMMLHYFSEAKCNGCREQACALFKSCHVRDCFREKGVDFCFQCTSFPCEQTGFDEHLQKRFISINEKIRKIGIENYYEEIKDVPRY